MKKTRSELGVVEVVTKPFSLIALLSLVRQTMGIRASRVVFA